jgi:hypothetical protein
MVMGAAFFYGLKLSGVTAFQPNRSGFNTHHEQHTRQGPD